MSNAKAKPKQEPKTDFVAPAEAVEGEVLGDDEVLALALEQAEVTDAEMPNPHGGRPTKYTPKTISLLIVAFQNGYNVLEACAYSGISSETFYDWLKSKQGFSDAVDRARAMPNRRAKENVIKALNEGDINASKWWLERRDPEFKAKTELSTPPALAETREKIKEFLDEPDDARANDGRAKLVEPSPNSGPADSEVAQPTQHISE